MKKNVLALSIATMIGGLGFAGSASAALEVAESGAGHILVVPYYTAQNGNMTVFHLTNTDSVNGKAVKVRFRGASNSDDVLDFQVFLSPEDVWTAAVTKGADGKAQLVTNDNSCTLPKIEPGKPVPFVTDRLKRKGWTDADKAEQTLEGYVEILTMADIPPSNLNNSLFKAIKHKNGVAPCTANVLNATLDNDKYVEDVPGEISLHPRGAAAANTNVDLRAPNVNPSLLGQWYVINVEQTTTYSGVTPAVKATTQPLNVFSPQKNGPAVLETADPLMVTKAIAAQYYDVPDLSTPYEATTADAAEQATALTAALASTAVLNQYATDAEVSAKTDWVFSMPTRRYSIAANYDAKDYTGISLSTATAKEPGDGSNLKYRVVNENVAGNIFTEDNGERTSVNSKGQICVASANTVFLDREETKPEAATDEPVFSPGVPGKPKVFELCGEVGVLAFSEDASALGATLTRQNVDAKYTNGWGTVSFSNNVPVLGAAFIKLSNPEAAPGTSGTYGLTWAHSFTK